MGGDVLLERPELDLEPKSTTLGSQGWKHQREQSVAEQVVWCKPPLTNTRATLEPPKCPVSGSSHLPCPLVVCRKPERWELSEGKGRGFPLQETNFSIYPSSAFILKCFLCASGQRTRVAPMLVRTGMELQPDPLSIKKITSQRFLSILGITA